MSELLDALDAIEKLAEAATKGPWFKFLSVHTSAWTVQVGRGWLLVLTKKEPTGVSEQEEADAAFIAESRTLIPRLVKALRIAEEKIDQVSCCGDQPECWADQRKANAETFAAMLACLRGTEEEKGTK